MKKKIVSEKKFFVSPTITFSITFPLFYCEGKVFQSFSRTSFNFKLKSLLLQKFMSWVSNSKTAHKFKKDPLELSRREILSFSIPRHILYFPLIDLCSAQHRLAFKKSLKKKITQPRPEYCSILQTTFWLLSFFHKISIRLTRWEEFTRKNFLRYL